MPVFKYYSPYRRPNFYNYYRPYGTDYAPSPSHSCPPDSPSKAEPASQTDFQSERTSNTIQNRSKPNPDDNVWLDLFGIKLYFDDVLILSLLFFLYKEEVKDEGLFLALILLLIS